MANGMSSHSINRLVVVSVGFLVVFSLCAREKHAGLPAVWNCLSTFQSWWVGISGCIPVHICMRMTKEQKKHSENKAAGVPYNQKANLHITFTGRHLLCGFRLCCLYGQFLPSLSGFCVTLLFNLLLFPIFTFLFSCLSCYFFFWPNVCTFI